MEDKKTSDIIKHLRILKDWDIQVNRKEYEGQVNISPKGKRAVIYPWGFKSPKPTDFEFHEVLHIALRALWTMDKRKIKNILIEEEKLIQDICIIHLKGLGRDD